MLLTGRFETASAADVHQSDAHAIAAALHVPVRGNGGAYGTLRLAAAVS